MVCQPEGFNLSLGPKHATMRHWQDTDPAASSLPSLVTFVMRRSTTTITLIALAVSFGTSARADTVDFPEVSISRQTKQQIRWPTTVVEVALSDSLKNPGPNTKPGSDVIGAVRRALAHWSGASNVMFLEKASKLTSISPITEGDGVNLISIADTAENEAIFSAGEMVGRTRVFYDPDNGEIAEADLCLNPHPLSPEGIPVQFSTDGTPGTYDLEATFTHEIGHLLGLDHSLVLASTMQAHQALNGTYDLPAFMGRTLSEEDRQRVRSLYGPEQRTGVIDGRIAGGSGGGSSKSNAAQIWVEDTATGRVVAGAVTAADGSYRLEGLAEGRYRVLAQPLGDNIAFTDNVLESSPLSDDTQRRFRTFELGNFVAVKSAAVVTANFNIIPQSTPSSLNPRLIGVNSGLSTAALPVEAGKQVKVYLGGEGIDQVPGTSISVSSPFFTVNPNSLTREQFGTQFPVISFDLTVAPNTPFGDYSIRLQSNSGEVAYVPGSITVDPGAASSSLSPSDDFRFFVTQHYKDFLGRQPDQASVDYWVNQFTQCKANGACLRARRVDVSAAFFNENELQLTGAYVYGLYSASFGRRPSLSEFERSRDEIAGNGNSESSWHSLGLAFVNRAEFVRKYAPEMKAEDFVDSILMNALHESGIDQTSRRSGLIALYDGTNDGRAAILSSVIANQAFTDADYNKALVLTQYFGYLRRDPDEGGYGFWLNALKNKPPHDREAARSMVCAFVNSAEYQSRFGMTITHTDGECGW